MKEEDPSSHWTVLTLISNRGNELCWFLCMFECLYWFMCVGVCLCVCMQSCVLECANLCNGVVCFRSVPLSPPLTHPSALPLTTPTPSCRSSQWLNSVLLAHRLFNPSQILTLFLILNPVHLSALAPHKSNQIEITLIKTNEIRRSM